MKRLAVLLALTGVPVNALASGDAPDWVRQAAAAAPSTSAAVVLLDDLRVTIEADGRMRSARRYAVRVNDRSAREAAVLREVYLTGSGRMRELRAWVVRGDDARTLGGAHTVDAALVNNDVYNEVRVRAIGAVDEIMPGDVFAAEAEQEDRVLFSQFEWALQQRWPVRQARRTVTLPRDWRAEAIVFNGPTPDPQRQGQTVTWEFRDLPELVDEPGMPSLSGLAPRLAVSVFAPAPASAPGQFETWREVAAWLQALSQETGPPAPSVVTRAREVTSGATSPFDQVAAIGRYAQRIQYVSIQTGIGRGGGYQPRPAPIVLERNYGDCKDKASLMRSMLTSVGIKSYLVSLYSGDRTYVRAQWPSPQQFNHAIIAVSVPEIPSGVTSGLMHPTLGPLLLFDPTDEQTPVGELPLHEQGSLALIVTGDEKALVRLPSTPETHHRRVRTVTAALDTSGGLSAAVSEELSGAVAASERSARAAQDSGAYLRTVMHRVADAVPRARVSGLTAEPKPARPGTLVVSYQVTASDVVQFQGPLVLVRLPLDATERVDLPASRIRRTPIELEPRSASETIRLSLPAGWSVDEVPANVSLSTSFGRYALAYAIHTGDLVVTRTLDVPLQTIDPEKYGEARAFFDAVRSADTAVVILKR